MSPTRSLLTLVGAAAITATHPAAGADGRFPWLTDLDEARSIAAAEQRPLLIVFRCEP